MVRDQQNIFASNEKCLLFTWIAVKQILAITNGQIFKRLLIFFMYETAHIVYSVLLLYFNYFMQKYTENIKAS